MSLGWSNTVTDTGHTSQTQRTVRFGHHYTYPSLVVPGVLVCSTSVTVTSPSFDSLRLVVFLTFLVLRSVLVLEYCTWTSTSAMVLNSLTISRGRDPNSNGELRLPNRRNYSRMLSDAPPDTEGGVWDLNLEEWRRGRCAGDASVANPCIPQDGGQVYHRDLRPDRLL
jgi:hypothetical protein